MKILKFNLILCRDAPEAPLTVNSLTVDQDNTLLGSMLDTIVDKALDIKQTLRFNENRYWSKSVEIKNAT